MVSTLGVHRHAGLGDRPHQWLPDEGFFRKDVAGRVPVFSRECDRSCEGVMLDGDFWEEADGSCEFLLERVDVEEVGCSSTAYGRGRSRSTSDWASAIEGSTAKTSPVIVLITVHI
jgi:hypothetical protein